MTDRAFTRVVEDLYAGTLDDEAWGRAIIGVADLVRASDVLLLAFNPSTGAVLRDEQHRFDPSVVDTYRRHWSYHDPRLTALLPVGHPATELTLAIPQWSRQPILNEFLLPNDSPHIMAVWLHRSSTKAVALSVQGTVKRGPFGDHDLETFGRVLPHVNRAFEIRARLEQAQVRSATLAKSLDCAGPGVVVLDACGKLLEANKQAEVMLREEHGMRRNLDGTLWLREPAGGVLTRWVRSGQPPPISSADGLLHVPRDQRLPVSVLVTPLPRQTYSWLGADPSWLVLLMDPERRIEVSIELIERDLKITAREAEVSALLLAGLAVQRIAERLGVSAHTVRTQLKSIFGKTGVHTQSELIRRVAQGPALLRQTIPKSVHTSSG